MDRERQSEEELWDTVREKLGTRTLRLGEHWSYNLRVDPKRLAFVLSRYKFAAKLASRDRRVLELGCSEGIGTPILAEFACSYTGVDMDATAIEAARENWGGERIRFIEDDFLGKNYGAFDTVVSLDVVEHIHKGSEDLFFGAVHANLNSGGIGIVGTPNATASDYASPASKAGHVNLFDADRLRQIMHRYFRTVFLFGVNDEVVHTGYAPMSHYLVAVGCNRIGE